MRKISTIALAMFAFTASLFAQSNPYDYYYPMGVQLIETEYYNGYEARYRYIMYDFINLTKVVDRRVVANRSFNGYSYRDLDVDYVKNYTLYVNRIRANNLTDSQINDYIIYKCPKGTETTTWVNSGKSSLGVYYYNNGEATKVSISYNGRTFQALRVINWEEWGDGAKAETVFWVRNWGDAKQVSDENMSHRVLRVMDKDANKAYAFNRHRPDIVLINLGTNDFSPVAIPTPEQYAGAYVKLIQTLREHYGEVPVLCIEPHSANAYLHTALQEVQRRTVGMPKVFFANSLQNMVTEQYDMGADWHPNYQGQRKIASCLIPQISAIMSWALEDKVIR